MLKLSRWIAAAALAAVLVSPLAAEAATHPPESSSPVTVIERWLAPLLRLLGGTTAGTEPSSGDPEGNETDAGPHSDPDGLTVGNGTNAGPQTDPDGLTVG